MLSESILSFEVASDILRCREVCVQCISVLGAEKVANSRRNYCPPTPIGALKKWQVYQALMAI